MKLTELARVIGASILPEGAAADIEIARIYAGDRVSDLLEQASAETLIVTNLASRQLLRLADLMDVPAICFVGGTTPDEALIGAAREHGTALLVSPAGLFETCGRLYGRVQAESGEAR